MKGHVLSAPAIYTRASDFVTLTKPRLNMLVIATATAGYYLGAGSDIDLALVLHTVLGTALVAGGASAFNQLLEWRRDQLMDRTQHRPLPSGRMPLRDAFWFALMLSALGLGELAVGVNLVAAGVALATLLIYALVYTPLKPRTSFATVVGAIPGALPPMIGWAAGTGTISREAWVLCGIVFLWQMPHFLAIAWLYRDDYARAGFPLLPVVEPDGRSTASQVAAYAASLVPISLVPTLMGMTRPLYFAGALILGLGFLTVCFRFARHRTDDRARALFLASIIYLPLLFALMVATRRG